VHGVQSPQKLNQDQDHKIMVFSKTIYYVSEFVVQYNLVSFIMVYIYKCRNTYTKVKQQYKLQTVNW